jgi:3-dehydroquinate synthase
MRTVRVELDERAYDVAIGHSILIDRLENLFNREKPYSERPAPSVAVIMDERLKESWGPSIETASVIAIVNCLIYWVPAGESSKSLSHYEAILRWLAKEKFTRNAVIMGVGGGVIGDLAGFVAATYLRGIAFVQVPTTLLAMVDSSVGGKTGVNLPEGKNLVGAFHQPRLVVADLDTLTTLPAREFAAGMAEVIKYGAIRDRALFGRVANGVTPGDDDLADIVTTCVTIKARIVERDEFETKGERALLNFGHTLGHAIEKATGYTRYLHGEAISLGMRAAAWLSVWHPETRLPEADARALEQALLDNDLPLNLDPAIDRNAILAALGNDKKVAADGGNRWVLLKALGKAESGQKVPDDLVNKAVQLLRDQT